MVIVERNKKSIFRQYELIALVLIIIIAIALLFILTIVPSKKIYELNNYQNGKYSLSGFVSNIKTQNNYTKFKLNDSTGSIQIIAFYKITDINIGSQINIICDLQTTQYGKECIMNK